MKNQLLIITTIVALAVTANIAAAETDHTGHGMNYGIRAQRMSVHQEIVDGVKATFNVMTMKELGMEVSKGGKDTHHISVAFNDMKTGKAITAGEVWVMVQSQDSGAQTKDMPGLHGSFSADFELAKKGKYGVMCRFILPDGKVRNSKFLYEVK